MSKIKCIIEMNEEDFKSIEYSALLYHLNATPITESDDCVSIQAVNEILLKYAHSEEGKLFTEFLVSQIKDLPPVLPKREQGEWIQNGTGYDDEPIYECSQCGKRVTFWEDGSFKGCPYCFAEMR